MASNPVNLDSLDTQQLNQVKKQLEEELDHLTTSFNQLRAAQKKFKECLDAINTGLEHRETPHILVPLTNSLYCRGTLPSVSRVLVDVGTGFFVEKNTSSACRFYEDKINGLGGNLNGLEAILQQKVINMQSLDGAIQRKLQTSSDVSP